MTTQTEVADGKTLKMSHIWLYSQDTAKSIQFYRNILGLRVVQTFPDGAFMQAEEYCLAYIAKKATERASLVVYSLCCILTRSKGDSRSFRRKE